MPRLPAFQPGQRAKGLAAWAICWLAAGLVFGQERPWGLEKRIPWTTSRITGSPVAPPPYRIVRAFPHLQFKDPVVLTSAPGTDRLFVLEVAGKIYSFPNDPQCRQADLCVDLKTAIDKIDQVYGLTFHPQFASNRYCYICYRTGSDVPDGTQVSRFQVSRTDPPRIDLTTEQRIISWRSGGHNGGCLVFGRDGCLYITSGDGGPAFPPDPLQSGQDVSTLLSALLRINVDDPEAGRAYSIPADNPFVSLPGARGEIWAYGFRNPWKVCVDPVDGDLWIGDVGWELWEMVYRVERGGNYGWSLMEGPQPVHRERVRGPTPILPPTVAHSHIESRSITGGHVYRGRRFPDLVGAYVYGDYVTGKIWAYAGKQPGAATPRELVDTTLPIVCFGVDRQEELYVVSYEGTIHQLEKNSGAAANTQFPRKLSDTGLFAQVGQHQVAAGVIPYSIKAEPWMDGAVADRFIALPGTAQLGIHATGNIQVGYLKDTWSFPTDAVLMKTISLPMRAGDRNSLRRLETQILHYDVDTWRAYNFIWNEDQTDALLAPDQSEDRVLTIADPQAPGGRRQQTWHFSSRTECLLCHTTRGGTIYGFNPPQLDREHQYGTVRDHQLRTLAHIQLFREVAKDPSRPIVNPHDSSASLEDRARAYLHVNCAHCHRRGGGGTAAMDVQYQFPLAKTNLLEARPTQGTFGIHGAQVLPVGDPFRSILYYRMAKTGRGRMPYLGSTEVDPQGLQLMHDWIRSLAPSTGQPAPPPKWTDATAVTAALETTSGALAIHHALVAGHLAPALRQAAIQAGASHADVQIRDLFEQYLPAESRPRRLGAAVRASDLAALPGDAERGRRLFWEGAGVQCRSCHQVGSQGTAVGPELTQIGRKYTRDQLLESILEPSRTIDPKFVTYLVETKDGRVLTGVLQSRDEQTIVLKDAQAKEVRIAQRDVELVAPQQKSLMPELQLQDLTAEQAADLLAYLVSLR